MGSCCPLKTWGVLGLCQTQTTVPWPSFPETGQCCLSNWRHEITLWNVRGIKGNRQREQQPETETDLPQIRFLVRLMRLASYGPLREDLATCDDIFSKICKQEIFKLQWFRWQSLSTLISTWSLYRVVLEWPRASWESEKGEIEWRICHFSYNLEGHFGVCQ